MQQGLRNMLASSAIRGGEAHNTILAKRLRRFAVASWCLRRFVIVAALTTWRHSQRGGAHSTILATVIIFDCLIPDYVYNIVKSAVKSSFDIYCKRNSADPIAT